MKGKLLATTLVIAPLLGFVGFGSQPLEKTSTVWVDGGSTVRNWKCVAKAINSDIATNEQATGIADLVNGATVAIPVAQLDCGNGNGTMNGHMRKALKADANPEIKFVLKSYEAKGEGTTLNGELTIAGVTKEVAIPATITPEADVVRVKASQAINMKEYGVKPPSLMLGTMKVKENVTVGFDVALKR